MLIPAVLAAAAATSAGRALLVTLEPRSKGMTAAPVVVVSGGETGERRTGAFVGAQVALEMPREHAWRLTCEGQGFWCPTLGADAVRPDGSLTLPIFRAARVFGRLRTPVKSVPPETLVIQARVRPGSGPPIEVVETIRVIDRRFELLVPRVRLDLRLASQRWVPIYRWDVEVKGERVDLGTLDLQSGSSLSGHVIDPATEQPAAGARVTLSLPVAEPLEGLVATETKTATNPSGFFQFEGIAPGRYRLSAAWREKAAVLDSVEVETEAETAVGELRLTPPLTMTISLAPALGPEGRSWQLKVRSRSPTAPGGAIAEKAADREGRVRFSGLAPGNYELSVLDRRGSVFLLHDEHLDSDREVSLSVPVAEINGKVTWGDAPLKLKLTLYAGEGDRVALQSDEDGFFRGWMRRPNRPAVLAELAADDPPLVRRVTLRDFDHKADPIELPIRLAKISVAGSVVDEEGRPLEGARVQGFTAEDPPMSVDTDPSGRFELEALRPARYLVWAEHHSGGSTRTVEVDLTVARPSAELTLVLPRGRVLKGSVVTAEGQQVPAADLAIDVIGHGETWARTDDEGRFSWTMPAGATGALLRIVAPTHAIWSGCVTLPQRDEPEWTIAIPAFVPARVRLAILGWDPSVSPWETVILNRSGGLFLLGDLMTWQRLTVGTVRPKPTDVDGQTRSEWILPGFTPGVYAVARSVTPLHELSAQVCSGSFGGKLDWITVPPGGEGILTYDMRPGPVARR